MQERLVVLSSTAIDQAYTAPSSEVALAYTLQGLELLHLYISTPTLEDRDTLADQFTREVGIKNDTDYWNFVR